MLSPMHGPWHMPEHPDERDNSAYESALEQAEWEEETEAHLRPADEDDFEEGTLVALDCGAIECCNQCGGDFTWATCPHARWVRVPPKDQ